MVYFVSLLQQSKNVGTKLLKPTHIILISIIKYVNRLEKLKYHFFC